MASIFSQCSSDEAHDHIYNDFLEFVQDDEREKLEEINTSIIKRKIVRETFNKKLSSMIFKKRDDIQQESPPIMKNLSME